MSRSSRSTSASEPPTLDPNMAQDSTSIAMLRALQRGLVYLDKDLNVVAALAESCRDLGRRQDADLPPCRTPKYSNGDPIVAGDFVYSLKRLARPAHCGPVLLRHGRGRRRPRTARAWPARSPAPSDADDHAALDKLGVSAPDDKTVRRQRSTPRRPTS